MKSLMTLWLVLRVHWSNFRNRNDISDIDVNIDIKSVTDLVAISKNLYNNFQYTYDGLSDLFDSMHFPAYCYSNLRYKTLYDDCDGYHAALYHIAQKNNLNASLLTYITKDITKSHTILVVKQNGGWYGVDYTRKLFKSNTIMELIGRDDVMCYNLVKFDYSKNKYYIEKEI